MGDDFRDRFFTPFVLPLTVLGVILLVGITLSRILLAVSELGSAFVALLAAGYVMAMAFFVENRKRITAQALGIALAVGLIGLIGAGAVASAAGMRELHEEEHGGEGGGEGGGGAASNEPVFVAIDNQYESAPSELPPGEVELTLENNGSIEHNVTFEETEEEVLNAGGGSSETASVTLEEGDITYFCSVPGHREAGMEGTLTVSSSAEGASPDGESSATSSEGGESSSESSSESGMSSSETAESSSEG